MLLLTSIIVGSSLLLGNVYSSKLVIPQKGDRSNKEKIATCIKYEEKVHFFGN